MNQPLQITAALCGPVFIVLFIAGWWLAAGFVPPHPPLADAATVAASYRDNTGSIRLGMLVAMISSGFIIPFVGVIGAQLRRIEEGVPVLTYIQLVAGAITVLIFLVPSIMWTAAAYRPERAPEVIQAFNDFGWLFLLMTFIPFFMQLFAIGFAVLTDRHAPPLFPRWVGYFNFWAAILFMPGGLITFFRTGPFAWNGLLAFWMPLVVFVLWYAVMTVVLIGAIRTQRT